jgi:hypothetical protein
VCGALVAREHVDAVLLFNTVAVAFHEFTGAILFIVYFARVHARSYII